MTGDDFRVIFLYNFQNHIVMTHKQLQYRKTKDDAVAELSCLEQGGISEYHVIIHVTNPVLTFQEQLNVILDTYYNLLENELKGAFAIFKRYFLSDTANQRDLLIMNEPENPACACSFVEQPPLNGTKIALWVYLQSGVVCRALDKGLYEVTHGPYRHLWGGAAYNKAANAEIQTRLILNDYIMKLIEQGGSLAENCIRTWFFVQNVDVNYAGVVKARNEVFMTQGLTPDTHFIASTGIGGRCADPDVKVLMDTYAVLGICKEQIHYLYASDNMDSTSEYGVSFERGTYVDYGDRRQVFISGTASINNKGEVVYPGDIRKQTKRMWENVEALLKEAEMSFSDVGQMLIYLRDTADYTVVKEMFDTRYPLIPKIILRAPVCRSKWLIEMECMGTKKIHNAQYPNF